MAYYQQTMSSRLPPTPPEYAYEAQSCHPGQYVQDPYAAQHGMPLRHDSALDYAPRYPQPLPPPSQQLTYQPGPVYPSAQSLPPISSYYEPMGAPILPPLRINSFAVTDDYNMRMQRDQYSQAAQQQQPQQQQPQKEEKPVGGVSAKLDYDMERMTDFVAGTAQGMYALHMSKICLADIDVARSIQSGPVQPSFRKWVAQVLAATRLPSATILLSLHFLTVRIRDFPRSVGSSENQIYRLLAVSMILGSKFLDDNTFINRSWSDVSGIKVSELNALETEWLLMIQWNLHVDPNDTNGLAMWIRAWKDYEALAESRARAARPSPLTTSFDGQLAMSGSSTPYAPTSQYSKTVHDPFTPASASSSTYNRTPYLSADPWNRSNSASKNPLQDFSQAYPRNSGFDNANSLAASFSHTRRGLNSYGTNLPSLPAVVSSAYQSPWNNMGWGGCHAYGCNCMSCVRQYNPYLMGHTHAAQTVVG